MESDPMTEDSAPWDIWTLHGEAANAFMAAHRVVALRTMGMGGLWPISQEEMHRMAAEKAPTFAEAAAAAWGAALGGAAPQQVAAAWLEPISRTVEDNVRRLETASGLAAA